MMLRFIVALSCFTVLVDAQFFYRGRRQPPPRDRTNLPEEYNRESHYSVLGLSEDASSADIRRAYKLLARKYHPDKNKAEDAAAMFMRINAAHEVLSDPTAKREYDTDRRRQGSQPRHQNHGSRGFDPGADYSYTYTDQFGRRWFTRRQPQQAQSAADESVAQPLVFSIILIILVVLFKLEQDRQGRPATEQGAESVPDPAAPSDSSAIAPASPALLQRPHVISVCIFLPEEFTNTDEGKWICRLRRFVSLTGTAATILRLQNVVAQTRLGSEKMQVSCCSRSTD